jgi:hypothetical protein
MDQVHDEMVTDITPDGEYKTSLVTAVDSI